MKTNQIRICDSSITVSDIEVYAYHGVMPQERSVGNDFAVSVTLHFDAADAMKYDNLDGTVNYAQVVEIVQRVMAEPSALIEHVAGRLIGALTEAFPAVTSGSVAVTKKHPPVSAVTGGATFTAEFKNRFGTE